MGSTDVQQEVMKFVDFCCIIICLCNPNYAQGGPKSRVVSKSIVNKLH